MKSATLNQENIQGNRKENEMEKRTSFNGIRESSADQHPSGKGNVEQLLHIHVLKHGACRCCEAYHSSYAYFCTNDDVFPNRCKLKKGKNGFWGQPLICRNRIVAEAEAAEAVSVGFQAVQRVLRSLAGDGGMPVMSSAAPTCMGLYKTASITVSLQRRIGPSSLFSNFKSRPLLHPTPRKSTTAPRNQRLF